jgi:hypothetical protein
LLSAVKITGLATDETIHGLDFRPSTGGLYALGSSSRLYSIDRATGAATGLGSAAFTPALTGAAFGFDFNPVTDTIRVVSDTGQNLQLNPDTGAAVANDALTANAHVVAVAHANNTAGAVSSALVGVANTSSAGPPALLDSTVSIGMPDNGMVMDGGDLDIDITSDKAGLDIGSDRVVYGSFVTTPATTTRLYTLNPITGTTVLIGDIGAPGELTGLAIPTGVSLTGYGITVANELVRFNPYALGPNTPVAITGVPASEEIAGIDIRPSNGMLYAVTYDATNSLGKLWTLDAAATVPALTRVGTMTFPAGSGNIAIDFDPRTPNILRVIVEEPGSSPTTWANLQLNLETGASTPDTDVAYPAPSMDVPNVVGLAYSNNRDGVTRATAYAIEASADRLVRLGNVHGTGDMGTASGGVLNIVDGLFDISSTPPGSLDLADSASMDITPGGTVFVSNAVEIVGPPASTGTQIFVVNLGDGEAAAAGGVSRVLPAAIRAFAIRQN